MKCEHICAVLVVFIGVLLASVWYDSQTRSYELERQNKSPEEGGYTLEDYMGFMKIIGNDNMIDPRGNAATMAEFRKLLEAPRSILEIGPGPGDFSRLLALTYPEASVVGIDSSNTSLRAAEMLGVNPPNLRFELRSTNELDDPANSYDVITTTFVNHEIFPDEDFVKFLRRVGSVGRKAFIFNDYFRSFGCLLSAAFWFKFCEYGHVLNQFEWLEDYLPIGDKYREELRARKAVPLSLPPSAVKLATDGGMLSMRRAFSIAEYKEMFRQAGYPEEAVSCTRLDTWAPAEFLSASCRLTCFVNLTHITG